MDCVMTLRLQASSWRNPLKDLQNVHYKIRFQIGEMSSLPNSQDIFDIRAQVSSNLKLTRIF